MAKERIEKQMSESFIIGSLLAVTGGYFDAYTYISRGGVFANAQTGNIVLFGINLAHGDYIKMLSYMIPVIAFVLGIFTAEFIRQYEKKMHIHWRQVIIALEILAVVIVAFLPVSEKNMYTYNMSANVIISFVCSLQVQSFRRISGIVHIRAGCTGRREGRGRTRSAGRSGRVAAIPIHGDLVSGRPFDNTLRSFAVLDSGLAARLICRGGENKFRSGRNILPGRALFSFAGNRRSGYRRQGKHIESILFHSLSN